MQVSLIHGNFAPFEDEHGLASLPLTQTLILRTTLHVAIIAYHSRAADYVRLSVPYEAWVGNETITRVVSDFRASFCDAFVYVAKKRIHNSTSNSKISSGFLPITGAGSNHDGECVA